MIPGQPPQPAQPPAGGSPMGQQPGQPPVTIDAVMALLRDGAMRRFRIDIEVDSTITGDESQERQDRTQFIETTTKFIEAWAPIVAGNSLMAPLAGELLLFGTRAFRVGRSLEEVIEETVDKLEQEAAAPKPPPPLPPVEQAKLAIQQQKGQAEVQKATIGVQAAQTKAQAESAKAQLDAHHATQEDQRKAALHELEIAAKKIAHEHDMNARQLEMARAEQLHNLTIEKMHHEAGIKAQSAEHDVAMKKDATSHDMALKEKQAVGGEEEKKAKTESKSKLEKLFADISKAVTAKKKVTRDAQGNMTIEHEK